MPDQPTDLIDAARAWVAEVERNDIEFTRSIAATRDEYKGRKDDGVLPNPSLLAMTQERSANDYRLAQMSRSARDLILSLMTEVGRLRSELARRSGMTGRSDATSPMV